MNRYLSMMVFSSLLTLMACEGSKDLSQIPLRSSNAKPIPPSESRIAFNVILPFSVLSSAFDQSLPREIKSSGRQKVCVQVYDTVQKTVEKKIGGTLGTLAGAVARIYTEIVTVKQLREVCENVDHEATVTRDAAATVSATPGGFRLSVPMSVVGGAGFPGELAKVVSLTRKNFRGSITAFADVSVQVDGKWCPQISVKPDFVWRDKAQLEVASKFWIDIDGTVGGKIKESLVKAAEGVPSAISCDYLKDLVRPLWHSYEFPISVDQTVSSLVLTPTRVGFSGLAYTDTGINLALSLSTSTEMVLGKANLPTIGGLPDLDTIPHAENDFNLAIPARLPYQLVGEMVSRELSKTYLSDTPAGPVKVTVKNVQVYPSENRLVFGVKFYATAEKARILDVSGTLYLLAKPEVDANTATLRMSDISFSRILDNTLWDAISLVFKDKIISDLSQKAVIPLAPLYAEQYEKLQRSLLEVGRKEGLNISLTKGSINIRDINTAEENLEIVIGMKGQANILVIDKNKSR